MVRGMLSSNDVSVIERDGKSEWYLKGMSQLMGDTGLKDGWCWGMIYLPQMSTVDEWRSDMWVWGGYMFQK